jgi:hypothetical protein
MHFAHSATIAHSRTLFVRNRTLRKKPNCWNPCL